MSLSTDSILERIRLKSQIMRWRAFTILLAAALAFVWYGDGLDIVPGRNYIARVEVVGLLQEDHERDKILRSLAEDKDVEGVLVYINTPGGTVVGGESIYKVLKEVTKVKPTVSVMGTMATSAGYMVALGTEYVFASKGSLTGSIGVVLHTAEIIELAKKVGVNMELVKSAPLKAAPSPFEKFTPEARKAIQSVIDDYHSVFIDMVIENRGLQRAEVKKLADGRVYTGGQAVENNLIDAIGSEHDAVMWLQEEKGVATDHVRDVNIYKTEGSLEDLLSSISDGKSFLPEIFSLNGLLSVWTDGIM